MGSNGHTLVFGHPGGERRHGALRDLVTELVEEFWSVSAGHFHEGYDYRLEAEPLDDGSRFTAWFSDEAGTRNMSAALAPHLLSYFLAERRGRVHAVALGIDAEWRDAPSAFADATTAGTFVRRDARWFRVGADRLYGDGAETRPTTDEPCRCECWGCERVRDIEAGRDVDDPRGHALAALVRDRRDPLRLFEAAYFRLAVARPEDRGDDTFGGLPERREELAERAFEWSPEGALETIVAHLDAEGAKVAHALPELFEAAPDEELRALLDVWLSAVEHPSEATRAAAFSAAEELVRPGFSLEDPLRPARAGADIRDGSPFERLRAVLDSGAAPATAGQIEAAGALLLGSIADEDEAAAKAGVELVRWARAATTPAVREAASAWAQQPSVRMALARGDAAESRAEGVALDGSRSSGRASRRPAHAAIDALLEELEPSLGAETPPLDESSTYARLVEGSPSERAEVVTALVERRLDIQRRHPPRSPATDTPESAAMEWRSEALWSAAKQLMARRVEPSASTLRALLRAVVELDEPAYHWRPELVQLLEAQERDHGLDGPSRAMVRAALEGLREAYSYTEAHPFVRRVALLLERPEGVDTRYWVPGLRPGEAAWSDRCLAFLTELPEAERGRWRWWLTHAALRKSEGVSRAWGQEEREPRDALGLDRPPHRAWAEESREARDALGRQEIIDRLIAWFSPRVPIQDAPFGVPDDNACLAATLLWSLEDVEGAAATRAIGLITAFLLPLDDAFRHHQLAALEHLFRRGTDEATATYRDLAEEARGASGRIHLWSELMEGLKTIEASA